MIRQDDPSIHALMHRIWAWMPGRRDRSRVTSAVVAAATHGATVADATLAIYLLAKRGYIIPDRSGYHRGYTMGCCAPDAPPPDTQEPLC